MAGLYFHIETEFLAEAARDILKGDEGYADKSPFRIGDYIIGPRKGDSVIDIKQGEIHTVKGGLRVTKSQKYRELEMTIAGLEDMQSARGAKGIGLDKRQEKELAEAVEKFKAERKRVIVQSLENLEDVDLPPGFKPTVTEGGRAKLAADGIAGKAGRRRDPTGELFRLVDEEDYSRTFNTQDTAPTALRPEIDPDDFSDMDPDKPKKRGIVTGADAERASNRSPVTSSEVGGRTAPDFGDDGLDGPSSDPDNPKNPPIRETPKTLYEELDDNNRARVNRGLYPLNDDGSLMSKAKEDDDLLRRLDEANERRAATRSTVDRGKANRSKNSVRDRLSRISKTIGDQRLINGKATVKISESAAQKLLELQEDINAIYDSDDTGSVKQKKATARLKKGVEGLALDIDRVRNSPGVVGTQRSEDLLKVRQSLLGAIGRGTGYFDNNTGQTFRRFTVFGIGEGGKEVRFTEFAVDKDSAEKAVIERTGRSVVPDKTRSFGPTGRSQVAEATPEKPPVRSSAPVTEGPDPKGPAPKGAASKGASAAKEATKGGRVARALGIAGKTGLGRLGALAFGPVGTVASLGLMAYGMGMSESKQRVETAERERERLLRYRQMRKVQDDKKYQQKKIAAAASASRLANKPKRQVALSDELKAILGAEQEAVLRQGRASPQAGGTKLEYYRSLIR